MLQAAASSRRRDHVLGSLFADLSRISSARRDEFAPAPFDTVEHGVAAPPGRSLQAQIQLWNAQAEAAAQSCHPAYAGSGKRTRPGEPLAPPRAPPFPPPPPSSGP